MSRNLFHAAVAILLLCGGTIAPHPVFAADAEKADWPWFACVAEGRLPRYPLLARQARFEGVVTAVVETTMGEIESVSGANRMLQDEVVSAIRSMSFREQCHGQTHRMTFRFQLKDPPSRFDRLEVSFREPDEVVISANFAETNP